MKAPEFRELDLDELERRQRELDEQIFRARLQESMGQLERPAHVRELRRDLARLKTVIREKRA